MAEQRIGRYNVLDEIASGAQGAVYRAFDTATNQIVALKVLHASLTADRDYLERFRREAAVASSIDHPNVVRIFEIGESDGRYFIAMEFVPESLTHVIESSGALSVEGAAAFATQIADGLAAAHARGIVHRDMKPQNVLIAPDGTAKVTDFGIARAEALSTMTATGVLMGTPYYMSPEQALGERVDARSDIYALGCVLYQMLVGEVPFHATTPLAVLRQHIDDPPRPIMQRRPDLPEQLAGVVMRALRKNPAERFGSAVEMSGAVRAAVGQVAGLRTDAERAPAATPPPQLPVGGGPPGTPVQPPAGAAAGAAGRRSFGLLPLVVLSLVAAGIAAAVWFVAGDQGRGGIRTVPVIQTVVVEKQVPGGRIVETVVVERPVAQTVVVEKPVTRVEKVIETVVVEKVVQKEPVVETVIVEKEVPVRVIETVVVEKVVQKEPVVETVIVEKEVPVRVIETVVVEKEVAVPKEVVVEKVVVQTVVVERVVEKVVVVTATPVPTGLTPAPEFVGDFVMADSRVPDGVFLPSRQLGDTETLSTYWGILEPLVRATDSAPPVLSNEFSPNGLATAFEIARDGSTMTFTIRGDAEFHNGWGPLTARDICFSFNNASQQDRINRRPDASWALGYSCPNDTTFIIKTKDIIDPEWVRTMGNNGRGSIVMVSRRAFLELGEDRAAETETGTGPFESTEWFNGDRIRARPVRHYRKTPSVATYTALAVPDAATRVAMLLTGQAHVAKIPLASVLRVQNTVFGAWTQQLGPAINQVVFYSGNYWAETDLNDGGKDVYRKRPGFKPDADHPWIGDPDDAASTESARKVREALNTSIDRHLVVSAVHSGFGEPSYTFNNAQPGRADWLDEYVVAYDPDRARQLLFEAGYPNGFQMTFHTPPSIQLSMDAAQVVG